LSARLRLRARLRPPTRLRPPARLRPVLTVEAHKMPILLLPVFSVYKEL